MTTVQEIESAIKALPQKDLWKLTDWFHEYEERMWDKEIESHQKDENTGIAKLAKKALIAHRLGKSVPL